MERTHRIKFNKPYREPKRRKRKKCERYEYDYIEKNEFLDVMGGWVLGEYDSLDSENSIISIRPPKLPQM